ncbi:hypothetical protein RQP46_008234 [Phenoliferia psychrophenolica]
MKLIISLVALVAAFTSSAAVPVSAATATATGAVLPVPTTIVFVTPINATAGTPGLTYGFSLGSVEAGIVRPAVSYGLILPNETGPFEFPLDVGTDAKQLDCSAHSAYGTDVPFDSSQVGNYTAVFRISYGITNNVTYNATTGRHYCNAPFQQFQTVTVNKTFELKAGLPTGAAVEASSTTSLPFQGSYTSFPSSTSTPSGQAKMESSVLLSMLMGTMALVTMAW